ncbi:MAG: GFA family protein [Burkholderiales bacterium]
MHINGGCHCGKISYEAEIDPNAVGICHCTDCQTLSGTAFRTVVSTKKEDLKVVGEPKVYIKTAESGNKRAQAFCGDCGTPLWATSPTDAQVFGLRVGAIKQRDQLVPKRQVWARSSQGWLSQLGSMTRLEKQT